ncbi:MAG: hypothetical protein VX278_10790 [Myxococcota bacterium]|nr:hypothetical protein [Myxococcota bacterium]
MCILIIKTLPQRRKEGGTKVMKAACRQRLKQWFWQCLERVANRIHPTNSSGNNQSKM